MIEFKTKDGSLYSVDSVYNRIKFDGSWKFYVSIQDIAINERAYITWKVNGQTTLTSTIVEINKNA